MDKIKETIVGIVIPSRYKDATDKIFRDNQRFSVVWSIAELAYWTMSIFMSFFNDLYRLCRNVYIVSFVICVILLVVSLTIAKKHKIVSYITSIILRLVILGAGIGIAICQDARTIVIFISTILTPIMFISSINLNIILAFIHIISFAITGNIWMSAEVYSWTLTNTCIFSTLGVMVAHFINKARFESYLYMESATKLAEVQTKYAYYDQLTNLRNRRAYTEKLDEFSKQTVYNLGVIMIDINDLKGANDNYGHDAGDEIIVATANALNSSFNYIDTIYRLGGDEFCVFITDEKENTLAKLADLDNRIKNWHGKLIESVSISYGWVYCTEANSVEDMMKEADKRMYVAKKEYYDINKNDRRHVHMDMEDSD